MTQPVTFHTFASYKTWPSYQAAYLNWMKRVNHPDLRASNYRAEVLALSLANMPTHRISYDQPDVP